MTVNLELLEQSRTQHQQLYLSPRRLHKLVPGLSISHCKHLARSCATCVLLTSLGSLNWGAGAWSESQKSITQYQMGVTTLCLGTSAMFM